MAIRLQKIDETSRRDHYYLADDDDCYFLYEYTSGAGWRGGETNQLIHNLQKKKGDGGYNYKAQAIVRCAKDFSEAINPKWLATATLVPVPPSKAKADPLFDDRIERVCKCIKSSVPVEVKEIVYQINSADTFKGGHRLPPTELAENYHVDAVELAASRPTIGVVDDVLTTGSHFKAVKTKILATRPEVKVVGFFVARRTFPNPFADVSLDELLT
ncbi:MAG: hypothetical protein Q8M24_04825 [Pseudolabrys sp.]|nr:hypothetical protein [Pseudolabrys sp.]MDP2294770.1 hypothetical protein [Pseudolabrys sp.]